MCENKLSQQVLSAIVTMRVLFFFVFFSCSMACCPQVAEQLTDVSASGTR